MNRLLLIFGNFLFIVFFPVSLLANELTLNEVLDLAIRENPLIRSAQSQVRAQEYELRAISGANYPRIKLEEIFSRTNLPAHTFSFKLNQERIVYEDFDPQRLNNPRAISNFETRITFEIPIWLGGKIQTAKRMAEHELKAVSLEATRRREEVIRNVYLAYMEAVLAKNVVSVSKQILEEAKERLRISEELYRTGIVLLSDVHRARVHLSRAQEELDRAIRLYALSKRALEVAVGVSLGSFDVQTISVCPVPRLDELKGVVLTRADIRALDERIKSHREAYRYVLSENKPQLSAFAQYSLNSKNFPFKGDGDGYLFGINLSWSFDLGLTTLRKAQANLERMNSLREYQRYTTEQAKLEFEKAYSEYLNALDMLRSAEERIQASKEVLRVMELRYKTGLARMVDLLDAQTELDRARLEKAQAIFLCHKAYINLLFSAGLTEEVTK